MPNPAEVLSDAQTIAVVGLSADPKKMSHVVASYLKTQGYRIIPVNPGHDELLGDTCYEDLLAVPDDIEIDIVDIFRRPRYTADVVRQVAARVEKTGHRPVVWTQPGVSSADAEQLAARANLTYFADRCTMAIHKHLSRSAQVDLTD